MVRGVHVGFTPCVGWPIILALISNRAFPRSRIQQFDPVVDNDGDGQVTWPEFLWFLVFIKKQLPSNEKGGLSHRDAIRRASLQNGTAPALSDDAEENQVRRLSRGGVRRIGRHGAHPAGLALWIWMETRTSSTTSEVLRAGQWRWLWAHFIITVRAWVALRTIVERCDQHGMRAAAAATRLGGLLGAAGELDEAELVLRAACAVSMAGTQTAYGTSVLPLRATSPLSSSCAETRRAPSARIAMHSPSIRPGSQRVADSSTFLSVRVASRMRARLVTNRLESPRALRRTSLRLAFSRALLLMILRCARRRSKGDDRDNLTFTWKQCRLHRCFVASSSASSAVAKTVGSRVSFRCLRASSSRSQTRPTPSMAVAPRRGRILRHGQPPERRPPSDAPNPNLT